MVSLRRSRFAVGTVLSLLLASASVYVSGNALAAGQAGVLAAGQAGSEHNATNSAHVAMPNSETPTSEQGNCGDDATTVYPSVTSIAGRNVVETEHTDAVAACINKDGSLHLFSLVDWLIDGEYKAHTHEDPNKLLFHVNTALKTSIPDTPNFDFTGARGHEAWLIPQNQNYDGIWAGWNTEAIPPGKVVGDTISMTLDPSQSQVPEGAQVEVWKTKGFGAQERVFSLDEEEFHSYDQPVHAHVHGNWVFTKPGVYKLHFTAEATVPGHGGTSDEQDYYFVVGDLDDYADELEARLGKTPKPTGEPTPFEVKHDQNSRGAHNSNSTSSATADKGNDDKDSESSDKGSTKTGSANTGSGVGSHTGRTGAGGGTSGTGGSHPKVYEVCKAPRSAGGSGGQGSARGGSGQNGASGAAAQGKEADEAPAGERIKVHEGHFDYGPRLRGDTLKAQIKDDRVAPAVWRAPGDVTFVLGDNAVQKIDSEALDFLGTSGSEVYMIGQTQEDGVPWLGWNTQDPELVHKASAVTMTLNSVNGPGKVNVFVGGGIGSSIKHVFRNPGDSYDVPLRTHEHGTWVFSQPGTYTLDITFTVKLKSGQTKTARSALHFEVGSGAHAGGEVAQTGGEVKPGAVHPATQNKEAVEGKSAEKSDSATKPATSSSSRPTKDRHGTPIPAGAKVKYIDCSNLPRTGVSGSNYLIAGGLALISLGVIAVSTMRRRTET